MDSVHQVEANLLADKDRDVRHAASSATQESNRNQVIVLVIFEILLVHIRATWLEILHFNKCAIRDDIAGQQRF